MYSGRIEILVVVICAPTIGFWSLAYLLSRGRKLYDIVIAVLLVFPHVYFSKWLLQYDLHRILRKFDLFG